MRLDEFRLLPECPVWLHSNEIIVENEDIEIINKKVTWKRGTWKQGTWDDGVWVKGIWENGIWESGWWIDGTWKSGVHKNGLWENGTWERGIWRDGIWCDGLWQGGSWQNGLWKSGTWMSGIWENGMYSGGCWLSGVFIDGFYEFVSLDEFSIFYNNTHLIIGTETKTIEEFKSVIFSPDVLTLDNPLGYTNSLTEEEVKDLRNAIRAIEKIIEINKSWGQLGNKNIQKN